MIPDQAEQRRLQEEFFSALAARLDEGRRTYGDASLRRPVPELRGEIEQELLDICGWSYVLWLRVRTMKGADP